MRTTTEKKLREAAGGAVELAFVGAAVRVTLVQELLDADGHHRGACRITVEGRRVFGGNVELETPLKVSVVNALPGEEAEMERAGIYMVEALTDPPAK
jgi:hypothetical protein